MLLAKQFAKNDGLLFWNQFRAICFVQRMNNSLFSVRYF